MNKIYKKILVLFSIMFLFSFTAISQESSSLYFKIEIAGTLSPCLHVKSELQFENEFENFVMDSFGISKYELPNIAKVKNSFISEEYIKKHYPNVYADFFEYDNSESDKIFDFGSYYIICFMPDENTETIIIFHQLDKCYVSYLRCNTENNTWHYTKKSLEVLEKEEITIYNE